MTLIVRYSIDGVKGTRIARDRVQARYMLPVHWNFPPVHGGAPFAAINFVGGDWQSVEYRPTAEMAP